MAKYLSILLLSICALTHLSLVEAAPKQHDNNNPTGNQITVNNKTTANNNTSVNNQPVKLRDDRRDTAQRRAIDTILQDPDFGGSKTSKQWVYVGKEKEEEEEEDPPDNFSKSIEQFMKLVASGGKILLAIVLLVLLWFAIRFFLRNYRASSTIAAVVPPDSLFGLDVRPQSLPDDIPTAARQALMAGNIIAALSLLYRGALSLLIHQHHIRFAAGDTESDCLRRSSNALEPSAYQYFSRLLQAWSVSAYAHRPPASAAVELLCDQWAQHFLVSASVSAATAAPPTAPAPSSAGQG